MWIAGGNLVGGRYPSSPNHNSGGWNGSTKFRVVPSLAINPDNSFTKASAVIEKACGSWSLSSCMFRSYMGFVLILSQSRSFPKLDRSTFQCCTSIPFTTCRTSALRMSYIHLPYLAHPPSSFQPTGCSHIFPLVWVLRIVYASLKGYSISLLGHSILFLFTTSCVSYINKHRLHHAIVVCLPRCGKCRRRLRQSTVAGLVRPKHMQRR